MSLLSFQATGLAQTFAKDMQTRYGAFVAPYEKHFEVAYKQAMDGNATEVQWLNWARKVHLELLATCPSNPRLFSQFAVSLLACDPHMPSRDK